MRKEELDSEYMIGERLDEEFEQEELDAVERPASQVRVESNGEKEKIWKEMVESSNERVMSGEEIVWRKEKVGWRKDLVSDLKLFVIVLVFWISFVSIIELGGL